MKVPTAELRGITIEMKGKWVQPNEFMIEYIMSQLPPLNPLFLDFYGYPLPGDWCQFLPFNCDIFFQ